MDDTSNAIPAAEKAFSRPASKPVAAWIWGALGTLAFSFTLPATRLALTGLDATVVGLGRAIVAGCLAALLLLARRQAPPPRRLWPGLAIVGFGCVLGFPLFSALALETVPAAHGAVVVGLLPMATAIMGVLRGGERPSLAFWAASGLGLAAVLVFAAIQGAGRPQLADGFILVAVALGAWGYAEGGVLARELGGWQVISWALVLSAPPLLPVVALRAAETGLAAGPLAWLGFAYVSAISMFLGFFAWYRGLALGGVARIGQIQLAQPVLTLVWSATLLGEAVSAATVLAALAVMGCVVLTQRTRIRRAS
ncbi:MAG TPA: DMT family transporter [Stellaceae bacterium]|nr:DMT family transporter [Stellaceae bacterium]